MTVDTGHSKKSTEGDRFKSIAGTKESNMNVEHDEVDLTSNLTSKEYEDPIEVLKVSHTPSLRIQNMVKPERAATTHVVQRMIPKTPLNVKFELLWIINLI